MLGVEVEVYEGEGEEGMVVGKWMEYDGGGEIGGRMGRCIGRRMNM